MILLCRSHAQKHLMAPPGLLDKNQNALTGRSRLPTNCPMTTCPEMQPTCAQFTASLSGPTASLAVGDSPEAGGSLFSRAGAFLTDRPLSSRPAQGPAAHGAMMTIGCHVEHMLGSVGTYVTSCSRVSWTCLLRCFHPLAGPLCDQRAESWPS